MPIAGLVNTAYAALILGLPGILSTTSLRVVVRARGVFVVSDSLVFGQRCCALLTARVWTTCSDAASALPGESK